MNCAVILTTILAASLSVTQTKQAYDNIPDVLQKVLVKYEDINNNSNNNDKNKDIRRSSSNDPDIEEAIRKKITELKPILDDDRNGKVDDRKNGESFIDFLNENKTEQMDTPNQKYKKLRNEIEKHLKVEPISEETKRIVIESLDQIETELKMNDCVLKKTERNDMRRRNSHGSKPSIVIPENMAETEIIMKHIKEKWDNVVSQYLMPPDSKTHNDTIRKVAFVFLTRLRQFVFDVHDDYTKLQNKYEIKCGSSNKPRVHSPIFKQTKDLDKDDTCSDLIICSAELLDFLADFYNQLNETYTEVFKNYIEMYMKEVEAGKDEKESFKNILELILDHARDKINKMFSKELEKLNDILNNRSKRTDGLKNIIDRTVDKSKELIYASLSMKLKKLKPKLRLTIKEDIDVSIGIELGNLQKVFKDKMCVVFRTCNGDIALRKSNTGNTEQYNYMDPNSIKIRLRIGPIIPHKSINYDYRRKQFKGHAKNTLELNDKVNARKINIVKPFNISEYTHSVNVTRTTYAEFTEKATTLIMGNSSQVKENVKESEDSLIIYF
ncbi:sun domain-containing protein 1-like [Cydia pomonella]|uniref:sun domain-containing protein 1-like n=1 Tax=Cydia pomonella TaxID=82600 RepID=UPI002ADE01D1|nr:sun domain-containing protein 1-like [Cydia pomonella]